jgi:hypothetical protein
MGEGPLVGYRVLVAGRWGIEERRRRVRPREDRVSSRMQCDLNPPRDKEDEWSDGRRKVAGTEVRRTGDET